MGRWTKFYFILSSLLIAVLFQNCADPFQMRSFGNGDPYEGYSDPRGPNDPADPGNGQMPDHPGQNPPQDVEEIPVSDIDPDLGAATKVEQGCFSSHASVKQIWIIQSLSNETRYLIVQFKDSQNQLDERAIVWASTGGVGLRNFDWKLHESLKISQVTLTRHFAQAVISNGGKLEIIEFTCSR